MHMPIVSKLISNLSPYLLALLAFAVAAPAQAQTSDVKVNVPFAFESGTTHFAAGEYKIHLKAGGPVIRIEGQNSSAFQMTLPGSTMHAPEIGKLVFHRYGSQYILKEVWIAGSTSYMRTPPSTIEKELQLAQAKQSSQGSLTLVATTR